MRTFKFWSKVLCEGVGLALLMVFTLAFMAVLSVVVS